MSLQETAPRVLRPLWSSLDAHQLRYGGSVDHQLLVFLEEEPEPGAIGVLVVGQLLLLQVLGDNGFDLQRQRQHHLCAGCPGVCTRRLKRAQKTHPTFPKLGWSRQHQL